MKKSKKVLIAVSLGCLPLAGIILAQASRANLSEAFGGTKQTSYSLSLSSANKMTSEEATAMTFTRNTNLGNSITYVLNNTTYTSNKSAFAKVNPTGGYIRNETPVNGIYQISMTVKDGSFNLSFGNTFGTYTTQTETITVTSGETVTHVFEVNNFSYFSINNNDSNSSLIYNFTAEYSCVAPVIPSGDYVTYTFAGEEKDDAGYAEGTILAHNESGFAANDVVSFYWGNGSGKLNNYYELGNVEVESATTDVAITMGENVVIPSNATKVIAELNGVELATYDIPNEKKNTESVIHKYATISDPHLNYSNGQKHLEEALNRFEDDGIEYVISSGDTGRDASDYSKYVAACQDSDFTGLIFASMGNHEQTTTGPGLFKNYAIYNGATKTFISLDNAQSYFANTYNNPSLPVSVFYDDLEGNGETYYYYATIANNLYIFMDQMLDSEGNTPNQDNFSSTQMSWVESVLATYSGDHTGDGNFVYNKYNLNIIEHAPLEQFKEGDIYPSKYGGMMRNSVLYNNVNRFVEVLKEYPEALFFNGHTHLFFDVGINYVDNYHDEYFVETNTPIAHSIHVPSVTQPRWYKPSGSMGMPSDYSNGSEAYYCYQYATNIVLEAHRLKEYNESKTTYDHNDYINKIWGQYSLIVKSETNEHTFTTLTDYAVAANGQVRAGSVSFNDTANGLQVTFAAAGNRFEIKTGNHSEEVGNGYDVTFLFKSNDITSITLGACNYTGGRYNNFSINLTTSGANYTITDVGDGWVMFTMSLDNLYNHNCGTTFGIRFYDANVAGTFLVKNLYIQPSGSIQPQMNYHGEQFYYQRNYNYTTAFDTYNVVEFDYYILSSSGNFVVSIMQEDWAKYYGYYSFVKNGAASSYDGVTTETLQDGYIHVTMILPELNLTNHQSGRTNAPSTVGRFYIRGDWSSAYGLIDNITFLKDDSIGVNETPTLQNNLEMVEMDDGMCEGIVASITHTDTYGPTSTSARKFTFANHDTVNGGEDGRPIIVFSPGHSNLTNIDVKNCTISFDIKLSSEFFNNDDNQKHTFVLDLFGSDWARKRNVFNFFSNGAAGFYPENTDNGWIHLEQDMSVVGVYNTMSDLIRIQFQFFGLNEINKTTAWVVIDNITFTPNA